MLKIAILALLVTGLSSPATSRFHLTLVESNPKAGATLTSSPPEVLLRFNERLDTSRRAITIRGPAGAVAMGPVRSVADTLAFAASIPATLPAGEYTVSWLAAAPDHAAIRGRFTFKVGTGR